MSKLFTILLVWISAVAFGQVGGVSINPSGNVPDASAGLDVNFANKGILIPRLTTVQRNAIQNPATGLQIYNTDCNVINYNAGTPSTPNWATINASNVLQAGVSIAANPIGAVCAGAPVTFTATPASGINSPAYQWQVNGQNAGTNSITFSDSSFKNGDVVTCILSSDEPCVTGSPATSNGITMLVNIVPLITGTTPSAFCTGSAVTLSASAILGTINWYSDSTGGSSLSSGASFTVAGLTASTTYYVDATANGCTTSSRTGVTATFYPSTPAQPGTITGPTNIYGDSSATYSITPLSNTASYAWTLNLGYITSGQGNNAINVTWSDTSGTGTVSVAAINACGTGTSQSLSVNVGTVTFSYTGAMQTFTVPTGYYSVNLAVYGAQGASQYSNNGGLGGLAAGTLAVTPGELLYVFVGGQSGFNGGGAGNAGCNGGDESDIRIGGTSIDSWVIVAGGGGGGGNNGPGNIDPASGTGGGGNGCADGAGGGGGGGSGVYGSPGTPGSCGGGGGGGANDGGWSGGGGGGGLTSGGAGGENYEGSPGGTGSLQVGGAFAPSSGCNCSSTAAGGGGGGYYGGGGGTVGCCAGGSGGGGSSWASPSITNATFTGGVQSGNGQVVITW